MSKKKSRPLAVITVRLNPEHWAKLQYLADEQGITRADIVRKLVADTARKIEPPKQLKPREIVCEENEWEKWRLAAASMNTTVDAIVRKVMNGLAVRSGVTESACIRETPDLRKSQSPHEPGPCEDSDSA